MLGARRDLIIFQILIGFLKRDSIRRHLSFEKCKFDKSQFGIYACSAENSSFKATFINMEITECKWLAHDGQQPDAE